MKTTSGSSEPHAPHYKTEEQQQANDSPGPEPTPDSERTAENEKRYAAMRESHEDLSDLTGENLAQYTCLMTAYLRAAESKRDNAICQDPFAEALSGDAGAALLSVVSKWAPRESQLSDYVVLRTRFIDEALVHRDPAIQQVVILGAGLDSRAYRMKALSDCHVIEVDAGRAMLERKQRILSEKSAQPLAKQHHVIVADLADDAWQMQLISHGFNSKEPTFWLLEGLLPYMNHGSNVRVIKTIDALSGTGSQIWADISGHDAVKAVTNDEGDSVWCTRAVKYGEDDPHKGVLSLIHWELQVVADLSQPGEFYGRQWTPLSYTSSSQGEERVVPFFFVQATKPANLSEKPLL
ncbi:hypothetical protein Poli38472_001363 [Pythium oligandrum]|uniref:S-adenosyl-L-methionine-dependent methyltransferase n=1 Tax=Pythium oligandrum TaxID=41045 RepID=A0A8K1CUP9_PYTOL|nr:hypothetical protein Poli38472_001363 [Pythium oligandrum]|eukprot:TMW69207.1 hypothetical protein Poli38472_001363 [Pythium oligandrum]